MRYVRGLRAVIGSGRLSIALSIGLLLFLIGGSASGRALDGTHILTINYTSNATWTLAGSPFILDGNVQVASGATLTIEPGVVVKFNGLFRSMRINGTLKAIGTASDPITFTSIQDDSIAGDSGGDGPTSGAAGQWYDIEVPAGTQTEFRDVDVRYGAYGSADWNYGAISISGASTQVIIDQSDIHDNQRSGVKLYGGGATISHSTISSNGNGISANMGWVALTNRTVVSSNTTDGVWFNYTSTYTGSTSSLYDSDVIGNGRYGINLGVDRNLPTSYWPHGNRNNLYDNASMQLSLGGYHPASIPQYNVDWTGNYWGSDVSYWNAPAACSSTPPNSPGHLAYASSGSNPPDGPISSSNYLAGSSLCSYDRFLISASGFNTSNTQPEPTLTPEQHATVVSIAGADPRVQNLLAGHSYTVRDVVPWSRVYSDLLIGAEVTFSWDSPASMTTDWPGISYDNSETTNPPWTSSTNTYGVTGMTSLVVLVDLTGSLVVSIEPGLEATVTQPPRLQHLRGLSAGSDPRGPGGATRTLSDAATADRGGYSTNHLQIICLGGTCFWNYDFGNAAKQRGIRSDRVDWPISMIFWNSATITRVKDSMCTAGMDYCETGGSMYARLRDGSSANWVWDEDKGVKTLKCPGPGIKSPHMRLYADSDDQLGFNPTLGYFVVGTTHFDHNECAPLPGLSIGHWAGHTEDAEKRILQDLQAKYGGNSGWSFAADTINLRNAESGRMQGSHRKQNDGLATKIGIPAP